MKSIVRIIFFVLLAQQLSAQSFFNHFRKVSSENELPDPYISCLAMDEFGFLWVGTPNGLCRFDGVSFKQYFNEPGTNYLPGNAISTIKSILKNKLLICTNKGVCIYNLFNNSLITQPGSTPKNTPVFNRAYYAGNNTIFATDNKNIYSLDTNLAVKYPLTFLDSGNNMLQIQSIGRISRVADDTIVLVSFRKENWAYYKVTGRHLVPVKGNEAYRRFMELNRVVGDFLFDDHNTLYCTRLRADSVNAFYIKNSVYKPFKINNVQANQFSYSGFFADNDSLLVVSSSTGGAVVFKKPAYGLAPSRGSLAGETVLKNKSISCALFDKWGNFWVGTNVGLFKTEINNNEFATHTFPERKSLTSQPGTNESIFFAGGNIFITTSGAGAYYRDAKKITDTWKNITWAGKNTKSNDVWNVRQHTTDTTWIGTQTGIMWLNVKNGAKGKVRWPDSLRRLDSVPITTQFVDSRQLLWMGLGGGTGLAVYNLNNGKMVYYKRSGTAGSLPVPYILSIAEDSYGNIWMAHGGADKVVCWNRKSGAFSVFAGIAKRFPEITGIVGIVADTSGCVWFGTNSGLIQLNAQTLALKKYALPGNVTNYNIFALASAPGGTVWFSSSRGLYFCRYEKIYKYVPANFFNDSLITGIKFNAADNKIYFCTPETINCFNALQNDPVGRQTSVFINRVLNNGRVVVPSNGLLTLPYNYQLLTVQYATLDLEAGFSETYFYAVNNRLVI